MNRLTLLALVESPQRSQKIRKSVDFGNMAGVATLLLGLLLLLRISTDTFSTPMTFGLGSWILPIARLILLRSSCLSAVTSEMPLLLTAIAHDRHISRNAMGRCTGMNALAPFTTD